MNRLEAGKELRRAVKREAARAVAFCLVGFRVEFEEDTVCTCRDGCFRDDGHARAAAAGGRPRGARIGAG